MTKPVTVNLSDLYENEIPQEIEESFGEFGLGIILIRVDKLHDYQKLRSELLEYSSKLSKLPAESLKNIEHADSQFSFGYSHGKESMNGILDTSKSSFYANIVEIPLAKKGLEKKYPCYAYENIWPKELPGFDKAFLSLGQLFYKVGLLLARRMDQYLKLGDKSIANVLEDSWVHKGRLLHYFVSSSDSEDGWCGKHVDHSMITGLTRAQFSNQPNPECGLYIIKNGESIKVDIPIDCIAFQLGEGSEIMSQGKLRATTHYVKGDNSCERDTFACFLQAEPEYELKPGYSMWNYTQDVMKRHY